MALEGVFSAKGCEHQPLPSTPKKALEGGVPCQGRLTRTDMVSPLRKRASFKEKGGSR